MPDATRPPDPRATPCTRQTQLRYLAFERSECAEGVVTLEAMASTLAAQHPAVVAEAQQVLAWAWLHFAHGHGPVDEGMDWDHDLLTTVEDGQWHVVCLTLTGSPRFVGDFNDAFGTAAA
jgi:hypothetical protein